MKPIRLSLRAFGPYTNEQVFDFRQLGDRSFFLIHGPTGSGKSTILDGISFALYGETSGGERQASSMRSDHASPETLTEVTFDFSTGGALYRVHRCPEQERARRRGEGTTRQRATATLWQRTVETSDSEDGTVIAAQWGRVTEEIERILGFRSEQFRQIIMLPQGQFQRFLLAGSKDREQILEVLFQTEFYRRVEEALKETARDVKARYDSLGTERGLLLKQASVDSEEQLQEARNEVSSRLNALGMEIETIRIKEEQANGRLIEGMETLKKIEEATNARAAFSALEKGKEQVQLETASAARGRKALSLHGLSANVDSRKKEVADASKQVLKVGDKLEKAELEKRETDKILESEKSREAEREEARRVLDQYKGMVVQVRELAESQRTLSRFESKVGRISELCLKKQPALDQCRRDLDDLRPSFQKTKETASGLAQYRLEFDNHKRSYRQAARLRARNAALSQAKKESDKAGKLMNTAETKLRSARIELERIEIAWTEGQAAILAQTLAAGLPCPVCGSTEHPFPARWEGELLTDAVLKNARKRAKDLEKEYEEARNLADRYHTATAALDAECRGIQGDLPGEREEDLHTLKARLVEAHHRMKNAMAAQLQIAQLEKEIAALEKREADTAKRLAKLEKGLQAAVQHKDRHKAIFDERSGKLPEGLRSEEALRSGITSTENKLRQMEAALEAARKKNETAGVALAAAKSVVQSAIDLERTCQERYQAAVGDLDLHVRQAGFLDLGDYQSAILKEEEIEKLEGKIQEFHAALRAAEERLARANESAKGLHSPDIPVLQKQLAEAKEAHKKAVSEHGAVSQKMKQVDVWLQQLQETAKKMREEETRYAVIGKISDAATGRNSQRITFQRFVLATLLDGVLETASKRLRLMSKGRFDLQRSRETTDQRAAAGLDLLVFDAHTGTTRPVNTLSGGESFLASLSLALGLADVVQSYAGGIRLDTIFVDEGFGSLDPEALDHALRTLVDLQEGNRLVGIISHVPELKERVDVRLEVTPGMRGSSAKFVI